MESDLQLYLRQIRKTSLLTEAREKELARRVIRENDQAARDELVRSNLRLVVSLAKRFSDRGMKIQDLIQEGNMGLIKAVEAFNPDMKIRFSTYASWWIKQAMRRSLRQVTHPVHIPEYMMDLMTKWKHISQSLTARLGREPSMAEVSEIMAIYGKTARAVHEAVRDHGTLRSSQIDEENAMSLQERVPDHRTPRPEELVITRDSVRAIHTILDHISHREAMVLRLRFGLEGDGPEMLDQIGKRMGLTRERVRQIERDAMGRLRAHFSEGKVLAHRLSRELAAHPMPHESSRETTALLPAKAG